MRGARWAVGAWLAGFAVGCTCAGSEPEPVADERPDLFLLTVDTLRADHLDLYGHDRLTAPWIESLGERGVVFEQAWSTSSWTVPGGS